MAPLRGVSNDGRENAMEENALRIWCNQLHRDILAIRVRLESLCHGNSGRGASVDNASSVKVTGCVEAFCEMRALDLTAEKGFLDDNQLEDLPKDIFNNNTELEVMYLSEMQLHNLSQGIFDNNTKLRFLRLNDNDLKGISGSTFKRMEELEELWLQDNNINELPPELFQDLENLQELYLSNNNLKNLPHQLFSSLSKLIHLDLSNNELGNLPPHIFRNITAVEFLKLDYNKIERLHEDQFQGLVKLIELYLSENKIEALPDKIFKGVKKLKALFMHYNLMAELPKGLFTQQLLHIIRVQAILKPKLRKLWSNVRSILCRGQNQEEEAENDQQGQIGNEDAHAINEEGEHIEMQVINQHDIPEVEAPELPTPQPAMEQACRVAESTSSSDYEVAFDIRPATKRTMKVTVHHGESKYRRKRRKGVQEGKSKLAPGKPTSEASKPEEEVASEDIPGPSDKGQEGGSKAEPEKSTVEAGKGEEQMERGEIPGPSDKGKGDSSFFCQEEKRKFKPKEPIKAGESEKQMESEEIPVSSDQGQEGESKPERKKPTEEAAESEEKIASEEIPVPSDK
ncbi:uncharacterized protein LOC111346541, partial [Stylophora pistillata]|uniref:uncharacterized protein LOC111346541 n=1 Tax=Stylophora pistillata TaxID=50429 RepID=UPI000C056DBC